MVDSLGGGHCDGSFHGKEYSSDAGVDLAQFACADRNSSDLSSVGEGGGQGGGSDVGTFPRHLVGAGGAGGGLFHHPCGSSVEVHSDDCEADDGNCESRGFYYGEVVSIASQGELSVDSLG